MYDVVVVGTGPAGAAAAYVLAKSGKTVAIADKRTLPRSKVCGGLITSHCVEEIENLFGVGIPPDVHVEPPVLTERVIPPSGRRNGFHNPSNQIHNVDRSRFDLWMTSLAVEEGADLLSSHQLAGIEETSDGVVARFQTENGSLELETFCLVGADGVYSTCRRRLFGESTQRTISVVQEYYEDGAVFEDSFYLLFRGDISPIYSYVVPKDGHSVLGLGVHKALGPPADLAFTRLREWLKEEFDYEPGRPVRREGWSIPFGEVAYGTGRALLVGDSGGFCEPFTGEGIFFGVLSAKAAATAILAANGNEEIANLYETMAAPIGQKVTEISEYVLSLTDEERERRIAAKKNKLGQQLGVLAVA